jgi:hypothetical protein
VGDYGDTSLNPRVSPRAVFRRTPRPLSDQEGQQQTIARRQTDLGVESAAGELSPSRGEAANQSLANHRASKCGYAENAALFRKTRQLANPTPAKPMRNVAQVDGSGTLAKSTVTVSPLMN